MIGAAYVAAPTLFEILQHFSQIFFVLASVQIVRYKGYSVMLAAPILIYNSLKRDLHRLILLLNNLFSHWSIPLSPLYVFLCVCKPAWSFAMCFVFKTILVHKFRV